MTQVQAPAWTAMTDDERAQFDRDGILVVPGVLSDSEIEVARTGVTANYIAPGFIDTAMLAPYTKFRDAIEAQIPARRFAQPDEIAALVAFLMSPGASYLTGAMLPVDGGLSAAIGIHR